MKYTIPNVVVMAVKDNEVWSVTIKASEFIDFVNRDEDSKLTDTQLNLLATLTTSGLDQLELYVDEIINDKYALEVSLNPVDSDHKLELKSVAKHIENYIVG